MATAISIPGRSVFGAAVVNQTLTAVSRANPCPICHKPDWCSVRSDGQVLCMRVPSDRPTKSRQGWWHTVQNSVSKVEHKAGQETTAYADKRHKPSYGACGLAPVELRDEVYRAMLEASPLTPADRAFLTAGGLSEIGNNLDYFGSVWRSLLLKTCVDRFGLWPLLEVPGFWLDERGDLQLAASGGILCAVRDVEGRVIALQIRTVQDGQKKYIWLSSKRYGGPSCGSPANIAYPADPAASLARCWITEGVKKSVVCSNAMGEIAVGLPGHNAIAAAEQAMDALIERRQIRIVTIALDEDADPAVAACVETSRQKLIVSARARGLAVELARWDAAKAKGIDDLILAGHAPSVTLRLPKDDPPLPGGSPAAGDGGFGAAARQILASPLPPQEKIVLMALTAELGPQENAPSRIWLSEVAAVAGAGAGVTAATADKKVGQAILDLAERGLVVRDASDRNPDNGHLRLAVAVRLGALANLQQQQIASSRKQKDRARKASSRAHCRSCGSELLQLTCLACGSIEATALEQYAESAGSVPFADQPPTATILPGVFPESGSYIQESNMRRHTLFPESGNTPPQEERDRDPRVCQKDDEDVDVLALIVPLLKAGPIGIMELCYRTGRGWHEVFAALDGCLQRRQAHVVDAGDKTVGPLYAWGSRPGAAKGMRDRGGTADLLH